MTELLRALPLLLLLSSLSSLISLSTAQTCGGAGFDVSALTGRTLTGSFGGLPWTVNPCGQVSGVPGISCPAQVCQANTRVSTYSPANITWTAADNGLVQFSQNGDSCGGYGLRQNTLRFVCNPQATTAYISDAQELPTCHYLVLIQTALVCTPPASLKAVGSPYVSDLCGGGIFPLSQSLSEDISFSPDNNVTQVYVNPCNTVQSPNCAGAPYPTSVCQAYYPLSPSSSNAYQLAEFDPTQSAVQYTRLSNGLTQFYQDGQYANSYPRAMNITYLCSTTPTSVSPSSWHVVVAPNGAVTYSFTINTPAVCGTPFVAPACGGAGFDLNAISGVQLSYQNYYYVAPCGNVLASNTGGCAGQACQGGTNLGFYDPAVATWTPTDNGVMQQIQDGLGCGGDGPRQTTLRFICNATATTPYILTVNEYPQCHYIYDIVTSSACGVALSRAVGTTYASDLCGGGAYNLNAVSPGMDIQYVDGTSGYVFINPCGPVFNQSCGGAGASVCYAYVPLNLTNPSNDYNLATWNPSTAPVRYTLLTNGITQTHIDGWYCNSFVRVVSISYICDPTATTPRVTNYQTNNCVYNITVNTNQVCAAAFTNNFVGCGGAGYDLSTTVAGVELSYVQNDDGQYAQYIINTCSHVAGYSQGCTAQVCQSGFNLSTWDSTAVWYPADNGVVQITQNGQQCGNGANRYVVLRFVCNVLATTPSIIESGELPACHYFVIVQTSAVCVQPAGYNAVGSTYVSDLCGGGAYDLALLSANDITYAEGSPAYAYVFFNPCGSVKNASCGNIGGPLDVSLCEAYTPLNYQNPSNEYKIAQYDPVRAPVFYTIIANGLVQYSAAGDFTGDYPRALNTTYICNPAATTPVITSYTSASVQQPSSPASGSYQQVYQLVVQTSVVCGAPYQPQQCGANGINLSPLAGITLTGTFNGASWQVAPCGTVHASATNGCTGQVCQGGYPMSYYDPTNTQWTLADNGLVQFNQDGVYCGSSFARATNIRYLCDASATTPYLSNAVEDPVCHYTLTIHTSLACNQSSPTLAPVAVSRAVGSTWVSDLCGGGAYLLAGVSPNADIQYIASDSSYYLFINPCGAVRNPSCVGIGAYNTNPAVCQAYTPLPNPSNSYMLAGWNPPSVPVTYTLLSNGIMQTHQDGSFCGSVVRTVMISYICQASATSPVVTSFTTTGVCVHMITIATSAVCGTPYVPSCTANGYSLASIASTTISNYVDGNYWSVSPCGNVTNTLFYGCTAQVCQGSTIVSSYNPASVSWTGADNGLVQMLQDGDQCGGDGYREGALRFVCNPSATTPYISAAGEQPTCHYTLDIQTSAVCPVQTSYRTSIGQPWVSDLCGGGAYDLTQLGFTDIAYPEGSPAYAYVFLNPCGTVQNASCGELSFTSLCEAYTPSAILLPPHCTYLSQ